MRTNLTFLWHATACTADCGPAAIAPQLGGLNPAALRLHSIHASEEVFWEAQPLLATSGSSCLGSPWDTWEARGRATLSQVARPVGPRCVASA